MRAVATSRKYAQTMVAVLVFAAFVSVGARAWNTGGEPPAEIEVAVSRSQQQAWDEAQTLKPPAGKFGLAGSPGKKALVLYDRSGPYGFLGELYAMMVINLAGRFGEPKAMDVKDYEEGDLERYAATFYVGSTFHGDPDSDPAPASFHRDVAGSEKPVVWLNQNIWNLAEQMGLEAFKDAYGWDPVDSDFVKGKVKSVRYKGRNLPRYVPKGSDDGVLKPVITNKSKVRTLAEAVVAGGERFPWALRSGNLTYVGEIPFSFSSEGDRSIALADLMFDALAPDTAERHRALVRLEDLNARTEPAKLQAIATYLYEQRIPYTFEVIPVYEDPRGELHGKPERLALRDKPELLKVLKYMATHGGVLNAHGYTHQYKDVPNPYTGVTGPDFEFYRAHISPDDSVILDGPVEEDSTAWATQRVVEAKKELVAHGLPEPRLWTTPHYAGSAVDYVVFRDHFGARYERPMLFPGFLSGRKLDASKAEGQYFPYPVKDIYGGVVLPENIGNYEPKAYNNHPPRFPAEMVRAAEANLAVRDGFASFFYHGFHDVDPLKQTVEGIQKLGYVFVSPFSLVS